VRTDRQTNSQTLATDVASVSVSVRLTTFSVNLAIQQNALQRDYFKTTLEKSDKNKVDSYEVFFAY